MFRVVFPTFKHYIIALNTANIGGHIKIAPLVCLSVHLSVFHCLPIRAVTLSLMDSSMYKRSKRQEAVISAYLKMTVNVIYHIYVHIRVGTVTHLSIKII